MTKGVGLHFVQRDGVFWPRCGRLVDGDSNADLDRGQEHALPSCSESIRTKKCLAPTWKASVPSGQGQCLCQGEGPWMLIGGHSSGDAS